LSNLNSVKAVYQAFAEADIPSVIGFLSPDIDWIEAEGFPYGGTYHGPNAVLSGVFMRLGTEWDDFAAVPEEFIDGGDTVVALGKYSGTYKATGKSFQANFAHVWKVQGGEGNSYPEEEHHRLSNQQSHLKRSFTKRDELLNVNCAPAARKTLRG
jgi:hypothetical protein